MKIVVIGGTGLIGSKLTAKLATLGHEAVPASPRTGVDTLTGEGLAQALAGAQAVVDVSNSPSFADAPVMEFFETSTRNLATHAKAAGIKHYIALSVVGTGGLPSSGYFRAKAAQEQLIRESGIPFTIVRAAQFFEFLETIAGASIEDGIVRLPPVLNQPMAAEDVAEAMTRAAVEPPVNGIVEIAGPEVFRLDELIRLYLAARQDPRQVVTDPGASYFGSQPDENTLVPDSGEARLGETRLADWLASR
jgi:uncharacterized protein YbjT (DUF2867 family)